MDILTEALEDGLNIGSHPRAISSMQEFSVWRTPGLIAYDGAARAHEGKSRFSRQTSTIIDGSISSENFISEWALWLRLKPQLEDSQIVTYPRKFMSYHPWTHSTQSMNTYVAGTIQYLDRGGIGVSTFSQIVDRLEVLILDSLWEKVYNIKVLGVGRSFRVEAATTTSSSKFGAFKSGEQRPQWKEGSVIALKRTIVALDNFEQPSEHIRHVQKELLNDIRVSSVPSLRKHPNLLQLYGLMWDKERDISGRISSFPVLVQECADIGDLGSYLNSMRQKMTHLSWDLKLDLCYQVANGLEALHEADIIHADLKCENILLQSTTGGTAIVKLTDFGFSLIGLNKPNISVSHGKSLFEGCTMMWMAPEVYHMMRSEAGQLHISNGLAPAIDVYSFGLLACVIAIDGRNPFEIISFQNPKDIKEGEECIPQADLEGPPTAERMSRMAKTHKFLEYATIHSLNNLLRSADPTFQTRISEVFEVTLRQDPSNRELNFRNIKALLKQATAEDQLDRDASQIKKQTVETQDLGQTLMRPFYIDEVLTQEPVFDLEIYASYDELIKLDLIRRSEIFRDLNRKARPLIGKSQDELSAMDFQQRVSAAYCAFQVAICFMRGFGVEYSLPESLKFVITAANGGMLSAITMAPLLCSYLGTPFFDHLPIISALKASVSVGPRTGISAWACAVKQLEEIDKFALQTAMTDLKTSGYPELGENSGPEDYIGMIENEMARRSPWEVHSIEKNSHAHLHRLISSTTAEKYCKQPGLRKATWTTNYNGETVLYLCCRAGDHEKVLMLLREFEWARLQVNAPTRTGMFPLHWISAMADEHVEEVTKLLVKLGAKVDAVNKKGERAVDIALQIGNLIAAKLLLKLQPSLVQTQANVAFNETLGCAVANCFVEITKILMENAKLANITNAIHSLCSMSMIDRVLRHGEKTTKYLEETIGVLIERYSALGGDSKEFRLEMLHMAIDNTHMDIVEAIFATQITTALDLENRETLQVVLASQRWSQPDLFKKLLSKISNLPVAISKTLLQYTIECHGFGQTRIAETLIQHLKERGLLQESLVSDGWRDAFSYAVVKGEFEVANLLLPYHKPNLLRRPTLFYVLYDDTPADLSQIQYLIQLGSEYFPFIIDNTSQANYLQGCIANWAKYSRVDDFRRIFEFLLTCTEQDQIDSIASNGYTSLHQAASHSCVTAVELLLDFGANKTIRAKANGTAYDVALACLASDMMTLSGLGKPLVDQKHKMETSERLMRLEKVMRLLSDENRRPISDRYVYDEKVRYCKGSLQTIHIMIWDLKGMPEEEVLGLVEKAKSVSEGIGLMTGTGDGVDIKNVGIGETFVYVDVR